MMSQINLVKQTRAQIPIEEREDLIAEQLNTIRIMVQEEKGLRCPMDNEFLLRFLRARKYNMDRTVKLIKQFFVMKMKLSFMTDDLFPSSFKDIYASRFATVLKYRDSMGRKILVLSTDKWDTTVYSLDDIFKSCYLLLDQVVASEETQLRGVSLIIDFTGFGFNHVRQFGPIRIQQLVQMLQDSYPVRFKEFHCVYHPYIFNMVYSIIKPFLKEKMRKRFTFHGHEVSSLHKFVSPKILPTRLGGELQEDDHADLNLLKRLFEREQYYKDLLQYGYQ